VWSQVVSSHGEVGTIEGGFGKSGKFKVNFPGGIVASADGDPVTITLTFKRYIHDGNKHRMVQFR
jgi:selenocysteine-specific elongation factor